jgi:hypothetical protein
MVTSKPWELPMSNKVIPVVAVLAAVSLSVLAPTAAAAGGRGSASLPYQQQVDRGIVRGLGVNRHAPSDTVCTHFVQVGKIEGIYKPVSKCQQKSSGVYR